MAFAGIAVSKVSGYLLKLFFVKFGVQVFVDAFFHFFAVDFFQPSTYTPVSYPSCSA